MRYDFHCEQGHETSLTFSTIGAACRHFESPDNEDSYGKTKCTVCGEDASRDYRNAGTTFYGSGWDKPAPSGKTQTVGSDTSKTLSSLGATMGKYT